MKKILYILLPVFTMLCGGCDDFLDIQPIGKVIPETGEEFRALITEAYSMIPSDRGLTTFRSDELLLNQSNTSSNDLNSFLDIWRWQDDNPNENTSTFGWRTFYYVSYIANSIIEKRDAITDISDNERAQLVGEAYMLRAYMHFLLVNLYAEPYTHCNPATTKGIPLKLNSDVNEVLTRNTVEEVYNSILSDIDEAEKLLNVETWDTGYTYRFNTLSAEAFRARVCLYMGNWRQAYLSAVNVIEKHGELEDLTTSSVLPNHYTSVEAILSMELVITSTYQNAGSISTELLNLYRSGDMRKSKYYRQQTASVSTLIKGGSNEYRCTFRSAEFYLIAAEAALELDDMGNAQHYLTELMKKRYHSAMYPRYEAQIMEMDKDELRQEIYDERFRELAFEGHRWFDLRRTDQKELTKTYNGEEYILEQNDSRYTLRIPSEAVEANPNLSD